ncbi:MAG: DUF177 domain-containing protein [Oscillospiraceae bacterium]|nr:DUF177 domain-containing protein [Oscillospiraceae bacterium]
MKLDLREIMEEGGGSLPFSFEVTADGLVFSGVDEFTAPVVFSGRVENHAGTFTVTGELDSQMACTCGRCLKHFVKPLHIPVRVYLAEELQDEDSEDIYLLSEGRFCDLDEIGMEALVLNMEQRQLCSEDCKGLCPKCGKNLNDGPCNCGEDRDPRLAVLWQLLENDE